MENALKNTHESIEDVSTFKQRIRELEQSVAESKRTEEALRESETKYRLAFESASDGIFTIDLNGNIASITPSVERQLGYKVEEVINRPIQDLNILTSESLMRALSDIMQVLSGVEVTGAVYEFIAKDGERKIGEVTGTPIIQEGRILGVAAIVRDITKRKQAEEALRESEERYRALVENASDIVFRLDETGHVTFVNRAALRVIGYEEKDLIGKHYAALIRPDMCEEAMRFFGIQFVKGIPNTYSEYPIVVKDGCEIWLGQNTQLILQDGKVVGFQAVARDITDRRRMEEALRENENRYRELSIVDDLTQLYNSRHFYQQIKMEIDRADRYGLPLTLLLLDLDDFKRFNDTYGHIEGNQVLMRLGQVVKRCLRQTDSAYRYGGEEFTIILPITTSKDGIVTAERIRTEFKKETFSPSPGKDVHVTVSIGLAQYEPQEEIKAFVYRVDQLMYQVKQNGKDKVCSEPQPQEKIKA